MGRGWQENANQRAKKFWSCKMSKCQRSTEQHGVYSERSCQQGRSQGNCSYHTTIIKTASRQHLKVWLRNACRLCKYCAKDKCLQSSPANASLSLLNTSWYNPVPPHISPQLSLQIQPMRQFCQMIPNQFITGDSVEKLSRTLNSPPLNSV